MTGVRADWARTLRRLRRAVLARRRSLAAGCVAAAVAAGLAAVRPPPPPTTQVLVAARTLPGGLTVGPEHVGTAARPRALVPDGALTRTGQAVGRTLAGPVRAGEVLTDVRLLGPALLATATGFDGTTGSGGGAGDLVAVPLRIADPGVVGLLRPGDRVDVIAAPVDPGGGEARVLAWGLTVLAIPEGTRPGGAWGWSGAGAGAADLGSGGDGGLLVLAGTLPVAVDLAGAAVAARLSVVLRPG